MGLYPRKGALAVGSDADIVLLDTRQRHTVHAADMHEADYSPWEGRDLACWPSLTMLRGKIVVEGGALKASSRTASSCPQGGGRHPHPPGGVGGAASGRARGSIGIVAIWSRRSARRPFRPPARAAARDPSAPPESAAR